MRPISLTPKHTEQFWLKVNKHGPIPDHAPELGPCWQWTGFRNPKGYGMIACTDTNRLAHRVSWFIATHQDPTESCVLHRCDNPGCVNPSHLFLGTNDDNMADMRDKGRRKGMVNGSAHGLSRLTEQDIPTIRRLHREGWTHKRIASRFGVREPAIWKIMNGRTWAHIP